MRVLKILFFVFLSTLLPFSAIAQCLKCSSLDGAACISENQVSPCSGLFPRLSEAISCPEGSFCVNGECREGSNPSCTVCEECNEGGLACVSKTQYRDCMSGDIVTCPNNFECFVGREPICGPANVEDEDMRQCYKDFITTPGPSTTTEEISSSTSNELSSSTSSGSSSSTSSSSSTETTVPGVSTESPKSYAERYCKRRQQSGSFESPFSDDCKEYIECRRVRSEWIGNVGKCRSNLLFNPASGFCVLPTFFACR
ncbi:uncharacterized protein LOC134828800 [Culicoides brevitarsis]|uniref:uncharacterized protein LOC134828800 n=1 Tax=Culicoides brevitarsis TaxID=469753 RepID=UPI00307C18EC